jgi:thiamine biosynthesis lipoprotein ApbE
MYLIQNYQALGTLCHIEIFDKKDLPYDLKDSIIKVITEFENNYSRFLPNSLISILNRDRVLFNPSQELIDILKKSNEYFINTNGLFDIKIGHLLAQNGYGNTLNHGSSETEENIVITSKKIELVGKFDLDLGGIGKSYLIHIISNILKNKFSLNYYLINFGGDIFVTSNYENPIKIYLENPVRVGEEVFWLELNNSSVCGSSPFKRVWYNLRGEKINHIINKSGETAEFASFVFAPDVIDADVYATCLCLNPELPIKDPKINYFVFNKLGEIIKVK